ncbi:nucleic-acid-binding protein [Methylomonas methanica]|uniref:Nucleic-acid-binding protein n=1 Tax=Methylomonas methanica TaxID=421 RepID=A0A177MT74_METMH|nr:PIN domain-containing protein [Methylomonas methanica]OAI08986.1 nucleic-acid-binding protein [Methylomonas methanica]
MNANFVDTNVIIYCVSDDEGKRGKALTLLATRPVLSAQVLNETAHIMRRKLRFEPAEVSAVILKLIQECHVAPLTADTTLSALSIAERYKFSIYDSLIIAAALNAGCMTLYSEDMQHMQIIENQLTIINPFLGSS